MTMELIVILMQTLSVSNSLGAFIKHMYEVLGQQNFDIWMKFIHCVINLLRSYYVLCICTFMLIFPRHR